jgi:hypothetical protein
MQSSLVDPTLSAMQAQQAQHYADYVDEFYPKQLALRAILSGYSMPQPMIAGFEAFHGEIFHLYKSVSGTLLTAGCQVMVTKWADTAHLGAGNKTILIKICLDIYQVIVT